MARPRARHRSRQEVTGLLHLACRLVLRLLQASSTDGLAGKRRGEDSADFGTDTLELGDRDELYADIGDRLYRRLGRVSRVDRVERHLAERRRPSDNRGSHRATFWCRGRYVGPAFLGRHDIEIVLGTSPRR